MVGDALVHLMAVFSMVQASEAASKPTESAVSCILRKPILSGAVNSAPIEFFDYAFFASGALPDLNMSSIEIFDPKKIANEQKLTRLNVTTDEAGIRTIIMRSQDSNGIVLTMKHDGQAGGKFEAVFARRSDPSYRLLGACFYVGGGEAREFFDSLDNSASSVAGDSK